MVRAQQGESAAFTALVRAHLRAAYAVALAVVGRPADAEGVVDRRRPELDAILEDTFPRVREVNEQIEREVREVLTPEQKAKFDELEARRPGPPPGGPPPGPPGPWGPGPPSHPHPSFPGPPPGLP